MSYEDTCLDCIDIIKTPKLKCKRGKKFRLSTGVCATDLPIPVDKTCFRSR